MASTTTWSLLLLVLFSTLTGLYCDSRVFNCMIQRSRVSVVCSIALNIQNTSQQTSRYDEHFIKARPQFSPYTHFTLNSNEDTQQLLPKMAMLYVNVFNHFKWCSIFIVNMSLSKPISSGQNNNNPDPVLLNAFITLLLL